MTTHFTIRKPTILDEEQVLKLQSDLILANCKFNGTNNLDIHSNYIEWLANCINQSHWHGYNHTQCKHTYLIEYDNLLIGIMEILFYINLDNNQLHAHIAYCIRPNIRRHNLSKLLKRYTMHECCSLGINKHNITFECNSKASNDTMRKILQF